MRVARDQLLAASERFTDDWLPERGLDNAAYQPRATRPWRSLRINPRLDQKGIWR